MDKVFDRYVWQARVLPGFIVAMPLGLALVAWVGKPDDLVKPIAGIVSGTGVIALVAHFSRDAGTKLQNRLLADWHVMPTTSMLRHRDPRIDSVTKKRYHLVLGRLLMSASFPSEADEQADPAAADEVYSSSVAFLREKTRDYRKFPLVFSENIDYGFRRNLVGMRVLGLCLSLGGSVGCGLKLLYDRTQTADFSPMSWVCLFGCFLLCLIWFSGLDSDWVKRGAENYARRLLESTDQLEKKAKKL